MASELVALRPEDLREEEPRFCQCYGRGSVFRREGKLFRVESGSKSTVHRALCLTHYFGHRCEICPMGSIRLTLHVTREGNL